MKKNRKWQGDILIPERIQWLDISWEAKVLYFIISKLELEFGWCFATNKRLGEYIGKGDQPAARAVKELEKATLIECTTRRTLFTGKWTTRRLCRTVMPTRPSADEAMVAFEQKIEMNPNYYYDWMDE